MTTRGGSGSGPGPHPHHLADPDSRGSDTSDDNTQNNTTTPPENVNDFIRTTAMAYQQQTQLQERLSVMVNRQATAPPPHPMRAPYTRGSRNLDLHL